MTKIFHSFKELAEARGAGGKESRMITVNLNEPGDVDADWQALLDLQQHIFQPCCTEFLERYLKAIKNLSEHTSVPEIKIIAEEVYRQGRIRYDDLIKNGQEPSSSVLK
ncbi:hypothetical protein FJZ19_03880 [Candidatus Pacearchaeota archaeon]|nr:hypothetical protein [Candidatus Pacearchaeota archaeon]